MAAEETVVITEALPAEKTAVIMEVLPSEIILSEAVQKVKTVETADRETVATLEAEITLR